MYERVFSGSGSASTSWPNNEKKTQQAAQEKARKDLAAMLANETTHDAIPCPQCFRYQPYMFSQVGYGAYSGMGGISFLLIGLGLVSLLGAAGYAAFADAGVNTVIIAVIGGVLWFVGWLLGRHRDRLVELYDPHEDDTLAERKHVAGARAILLPEYDTRQAARVSDEYQQHIEKLARNSRGEPNQFVAEWYLAPSVFIYGGAFSIALPEREVITVQVPENTEPGQILEIQPATRGANPFEVRVFGVRVLAMRIHPGEYEAENEPA